MAKINLRPPLPTHKPAWVKILLISAGTIFVLMAVGLFAAGRAYESGLKPISSSTQKLEVVVNQGDSLDQIARDLKHKGLIRSEWAFVWYVRLNRLGTSLKAGVYEFAPAQGPRQMVDYLANGKIAVIKVTILPGKRIDEVQQILISAGYSKQDVEAALLPSAYPEHPALSEKPPAASLEGYLFPETFEKTSKTTAQQIVAKALDELKKQFTAEIKRGIDAQGLTTHQAIILASIVEREASNFEDKKQVAQVLLLRFKSGIRLEADPTAYYGAIINGAEPSLRYDSPYNTYLYAGLPEGPIGNFGADSLKAVASPAKTDWLYFVAGDDGKTYFSKTLAEHQRLTREHCTKLCRAQ